MRAHVRLPTALLTSIVLFWITSPLPFSAAGAKFSKFKNFTKSNQTSSDEWKFATKDLGKAQTQLKPLQLHGIKEV